MGTGWRYVLYDEGRKEMMKQLMTAEDWTTRAELLGTESQLALLRGIPTEVLMTELTRRVNAQEKLLETLEREISRAKRNP